jgi:hypothetical protein
MQAAAPFLRTLAQTWRVRIVIEELSRLRGKRPSGGAGPSFAEFWTNGGLAVREDLAPIKSCPRELRLLVQPDGDVVVFAPRDFGRHAGDDPGRRALLQKARKEMAQVVRNGFGAWVGLAYVLIEAIVVLLSSGNALAAIERTLASADITMLYGLIWSAIGPAIIWLARIARDIFVRYQFRRLQQSFRGSQIEFSRN